MGIFSNLFGKKPDFAALIAAGAVIIDVRTAGEYKSGHVKGSKNIPLDTIGKKKDKIRKMEKPIILCCASGMRSGRAAKMLKAEGIEAYNGGTWFSLRGYITD